jgi:hypothetical protein
MKNKTISKAEILANSLINNKLKEQNQSIKIVNPIDHLRTTTATFINKRFEKIQKDAELEDIVVEAIKVKITDGTVNFNDLSNFLNQIKLRSTDSVESLLNFFKPTQGERSPLLSDPDREGTSPEGQIFKDATSQDLQVLSKLAKMLSSQKEEPKIVGNAEEDFTIDSNKIK